MPEGPSIVILKELLEPYTGKTVMHAEGSAKIDFDRLQHVKILEFKSWGKHTIICFKDFYIRIHLLMFGTYRIGEQKPDTLPRLKLVFKSTEINFYTCSVKLMEGDPDNDYDWEADIMSDVWDAKKALKKIQLLGKQKICDILLDQEIFSGSGNIIKNEVLFRTRVHPESLIDAIPLKKLKELIKETRDYSFDFYIWKKENTLKQHWLIYTKPECPRCHIATTVKHLGKGKRLSCFCENCQVLYTT